MADLVGAPIFTLKTPKILFKEEKQEQGVKATLGQLFHSNYK